MTVTLLVVDDHPVVRDGVASQLAGTPGLEIVGFADSGRAAIRLVEELAPDVVLLDLRLGDMLAPELIAEILRLSADSRILLFTAYPEHAALAAAVGAGAHGVLVKDAARGNLVEAVMAVAAGAGVADHPDAPDPAAGATGVITAREYDVLRRAAMGESNPEIAAALFVSRNTVKSYMQNILHKLDARNRVEAIARARDLGLL
jgi:two-component system nitrate/nitrite response regulator NarL